MSIFSSLYSGIYDTVYSFKLSRFRSRVNKTLQILQKQIVRKPKGGALDKSKIKHILIIQNEAFGDMIIDTPLICNLCINGYKVDVLASQGNQVIIEHNPYVNEIIVQKGGPANAKNFVLEHMKDRHYDMVLDARGLTYYDDVDRLLFPQYISSDYLIGWNRSNIGMYDESLTYDDKGHFVGVIDAFLKYMGIEDADLSYDLFVEEGVRENGLHYIRDLWRKGGPVVAFNPFSSQDTRNLSDAQIKNTINKILEHYPFAQIVMIGLPDQLNQIQIDPLWDEHVHKYLSPSIMDVVPLIKYADITISPDTSIVHIAAAYKKPLVGLYISAVRAASNGKEAAKGEYYQKIHQLKEKFFDAPRFESGQRQGHVLLNDHMFAPNNEKAVQLFSNTGNMADLAYDNIVDAFDRLVTQFVRDPQYVAPMKAIPYSGEVAKPAMDVNLPERQEKSVGEVTDKVN